MAELVGSNTTDLRFSLTPERVDATQRQTFLDNFGATGFANSKTTMENVAGSPTVMDEVSTSSTAMDAVSTSSTAMDAVSTSSTAMDAVSASQTARDAIGTDGVGYDAVASVAMAIGKYAAGIAGLTPTNYADIDAVASDANAMDAVSTSSTAMDAVSASSTAMDAVMASLTARSLLLQSQFAAGSVWKDTNASQRIWEQGETFDVVSNEIDFFFEDEFSNSEIDFHIAFNGSTNKDREEGFRLELDFDEIDQLSIDTKYVGDERQGANFLAIKADQNVLFETDTNHGQITRNLDTSGVTGTKNLRLIYEQKGNINDTFDMYFGIITGE